MTALTYSLTVTDWTQPRGYANSGRGWRVRLFSMPDDDWNAMGSTHHESLHRTLAAANKQAAALAKSYGIAFEPREP